jgi:hypothetical protein
MTPHPPIQSIAQAKMMRDRLSALISELVREYEQQTSLRVMSFAVQRKEIKDRRGYKSKVVSIGLIVAMEGDGTEALL